MNAIASSGLDVDGVVVLSSSLFAVAVTLAKVVLRSHLQDLTDPSPKVLIRDGVFDAATLRRRFLTETSVREQLTAMGYQRTEWIRLATIDARGQVRVLAVHPASASGWTGDARR